MPDAASPTTLPVVAHAFTLPELGEGLTEGEISRWLVREGDAVAENDPIVEIQTDKATVEVGSPVGGVVLRILAQDGEMAAVGATLALIGAPGSSCSARSRCRRSRRRSPSSRSSPSSAPSRSRR